MSASQVTPRPTTLQLALDKTLPPAPVVDDANSDSAHLALAEHEDSGSLPERPPLQRHWTSAAPEGAAAAVASASYELPAPDPAEAHDLQQNLTPSWRPLNLPMDLVADTTITLGSTTHLSRKRTVRAAPSESFDSNTAQTSHIGALSSDSNRHRSMSYTSDSGGNARDSFISASANSPETFFSPYLHAAVSPVVDSRYADSQPRLRCGSNEKGQASKNHSRPPTPVRVRNLSTPSAPALGNDGLDGQASLGSSVSPSQASERSSGHFSHLPDPSSFPLPSTSRMGSAADSASFARMSRGSRTHSHYSSDMSVRNSTSTRASVWTDRSQTSCNTSPGEPHSSLGFEPFPKGSCDGHGDEETEEIDEQSVGLGITSNEEPSAPVGSRRASAAPIVPAVHSGERSPALSGPFSHHRAPSWTRRSELGSLMMLPLDAAAAYSGVGADAIRPGMMRTTSEMSPKDFARSLQDERSMLPHVPQRSHSRQRCSSEASNKVLHGHVRSSSSVSSLYSARSNSPSTFSTGAPASFSGHPGAAGLTRTLSSSTCSSSFSATRSMRNNPQSPPRSSSLRQSDQTSGGKLQRSDSLCRTASIRRRALNAQQPDGVSSQKIPPMPSASGERRLEPAADIEERSAAAQPHVAATSLSRRVSDVSINSFLQGAEFSHILGAYADRLRWDDDGLYDFDESAETEDEDSAAVRTAQDGSAAIVHANGRAISEIEREAGPNTTHLVLRDCAQDGVLDMLERVLPATQRLLVLDVSGCKLSSLPISLGNCLSLEELDVSRNPLGVLPECISNLRALRVLSADDAELRTLPSTLANLQDLQCLSLRRNQVAHLPSWMHRLAKLDSLLLEGNAFKGVWLDVVSPVINLHGNNAALQPLARPATACPPSSGAPSAFGAVVDKRPSAARRLRSIGDLKKPLLSLDTSSPASRNEEEVLSSPGDASSSHDTCFPSDGGDAADALAQFGALPDVHPTAVSQPESRRGSEAFEEGQGGSGKWAFLRKIGRKASSSRLGVMYNDHVGAAEGRAMSPKGSRTVLRTSGGVLSRPRSRSGSASAPASGAGFHGSMSPPPLPKAHVLPRVEGTTGVSPAIPSHVPMTPFSPFFPAATGSTSAPAPAPSPASTLSVTSRQAKRRSFLPLQDFQPAAVSTDPKGEKIGAAAALDPAALARHRQRLRALMCYLRDLDDLTSVRSTPSNGSPLMHGQAALVDSSSAEASSLVMTRNSSIASGDSSASSSLLKSSASMISTAASTPMLEDDRPKRLVATDEAPSRESSVKDDSVRRTRIVEEIVRTEETYVKGLGELVEIYVRPAQLPADGQGGAPVVPQSEQRAVFGNVEAILRFHAEVFLPALRSAAQPLFNGKVDPMAEGSQDLTASVAESVANVFTHHAAFFKMYMSYINNCDSAQSRINVWMAPSSVMNAAASFKANSLGSQHHGHGGNSNGTPLGQDFGIAPAQRKKIKTFMKRCRAHPQHSQLNVESYLLLPVQRIPRYRLLIDDLVRSTDPARLRSATSLAVALEHVSQIATNVNESKRQSEQDRRLLAWQYRIRGNLESPLVQPHRRLIKDGPLRLRRTVKRIPGFIKQTTSSSPCISPTGESIDPLATLPADGTQIMQVDHLAQSSENAALTALLCNDVVVLVSDPLHGRDASSPVHLYAMLRLEKPVDIVGNVNLRLVDRKAIMYLAARSPEEALSWKSALNAHVQ